MIGSPLLITPEIVEKLKALRAQAERDMVNINTVIEMLKTKTGKRRHMERMTRQTLVIPGPWPYFVTFSVETGHPAGLARHMSMSVQREGRVPSPIMAWHIAGYLGFSGEFSACDEMYRENLSDGGVAVNLIQVMKQ